RILSLVYRARGLLAIAVYVAEQRVGIAVAGVVQRIIRILREIVGAGVTAAGGRDLFVALQVEAGLQRVAADDLAEVLDEAPNRVEVLVRSGGARVLLEDHRVVWR